MAFDAVDDPVLNVAKPGRSLDIKQMRDNQADHETRIRNLEDPNTRLFSHFNSNHVYTINSITSGVVVRDYERDFWLDTSSSSAEIFNEVGVSGSADNHYLRVELGSAGPHQGALIGQIAHFFNNRTKPLRFKTRVKINTDVITNILPFVGMVGAVQLYTARPTDGILLEKNGVNYRFVTVNAGAVTLGSDFAPPAASTWFEVEIIFDSAGGNNAKCYIDTVLKETLTGANLPVAKNLYACCALSGTSKVILIDRIEFASGGPLADTA